MANKRNTANSASNFPEIEEGIVFLRKISIIIGFILFIGTGILEMLLSDENRGWQDYLVMLSIGLPFFISGLINAFFPLRSMWKYPFIVFIGPAAAIGGLLGGSLTYTYPLGIVFVIIWLYIGIGIDYYEALIWNVIILLIAILADIFLLHYSLEYRIFFLVFLFCVSIIGFISSSIQQNILSNLYDQQNIAKNYSLRLEKELNSKTMLYASISHQIKTPLTIIKHYFSKYRELHDDSRELDVIQDNFDILERLFLNFLTMERNSFLSESVPGNNKKRICNLSMLINKQTPVFDVYFQKKQIHFKSKIDAGIFVELSQLDCEHILLNLLENALKYTNDRGHVSLVLRQEDESTCVLKVKDNGVGIDESRLEDIFEPFVQTDDTLPYQKGIGMGLPIVKNTAEGCGGRVHVSSVYGSGSEFTVILPLFKKPDSVMSEPSNQIHDDTFHKPSFKLSNETNEDLILPLKPLSRSPDKPVIYSSPEGNTKLKIMIVEDNIELRDFLAESFSSKYRVSAYSNGRKALLALHEEDLPDLVITDVYMEEMDGISLLQEYRQRYAALFIPFIFMSADDTEATRLNGLRTGGVDYIVKPFSVQELKIKADTWIELFSVLKSDENQMIHRISSIYGLSPRETQVAALITKGYSRSDISQKLFISINTVKTHVRSLYTKCGVMNKSEFFKSIIKK